MIYNVYDGLALIIIYTIFYHVTKIKFEYLSSRDILKGNGNAF